AISVCRWIETWGIRKGKPAGHAPDGSWYARSLATPSSTFASMYCMTRSPLSDPETVPLQQSGNSTIMTTPSNGSPNVLHEYGQVELGVTTPLLSPAPQV